MTIEARVFRDPDAGERAPVVCLLTGHGESGAAIRDLARELGARAFHLAEVPVADWDKDLSPWRAPALRGEGEFGGGADAFLQKLEEALPRVRSLAASDGPCYLAGYSLAGLFAVYALFRSAAFAGAASVSGSLWFPGFAEFSASHEPPRIPERVYFSLGDRESRTRNTLLCRTEDLTRALSAKLRERGTESVFELNPGGHFQDAEGRVAKALAWLMR